MKYKDQGKKMKMAGGGVAEDMKPVGKALGGLISKEAIIRHVDPFNILGKASGGKFDLGNAIKSFDLLDLDGSLKRRKRAEEENIS
mgnify:CR=1 FL=1|jgi:hypothetical protein|tara:strand:+ start:375 stop:632 length:258 start_codon:yes stop_codon:yes gene_type:complete